LIEDIITAGDAAPNAASALRDHGATVRTVVCAIDRSEPVADSLHEIGVATRSVLSKAERDATSQP
jgi:orotate phosphoribosyltransferase